MSDAWKRPDVDYLTRDYEGFRRLLLSLIERQDTPWTESAAADVGVTLVEILANQLDHFAYAGDRVAEEAFLPTARRREHARRHAALGDHRLDRGNTTSGHQHFRVGPDAKGPSTLPAGTKLGIRLAPGEDPDDRLVVETTEDARLDGRLDELALARSARAGATRLHLRAADGSPLDLRAIGLTRGARLCVRNRDTREGEVVVVQRVVGASVELQDPLGATYVTGETVGGAEVLGNIVPFRRGKTVVTMPGPEKGARPDHIGGKTLDDLSPDQFLVLRVASVRRLREEAEAARNAWGHDRSHAEEWEVANAEVAGVVRQLRIVGAAALDHTRATALNARLLHAAGLFGKLARAAGREAPELTDRVAVPGQRIVLSSHPPTLWFDGGETLRVLVGSEPWKERDDFLRSGPEDRHYVVELGEAGAATLRFGDGVNGALLPPGSSVRIERVTGDPSGGDLGAGALDRILDAEPNGLVTTNPLPTGDGRPPEPLDEALARTVRRDLAKRVVPVTARDHEEVLLDPDRVRGIAEARASVTKAPRGAARGRVDVVIRPRHGEPPARVLAAARALLREARLAGSDVEAHLCEPIYASLAIVFEAHPEITPTDVRARLRSKLLPLFADHDDVLLGRTRTRAEVYRTIEKVPGVLWSQILGFDRASEIAPGPPARDEIVASAHQVVRCLDLPDVPLAGSITLWAARRYRLVIELGYADPDARPGTAWIREQIMKLLSGPGSEPAHPREPWPEITAARIDAALPKSVDFRMTTRAIIVGDRTVERVPLLELDLPILDAVQIRERPFKPHFSLAIERASDELLESLRALLSGPDGLPVKERWSEITPGLVLGAIARELPNETIGALTLRVGTRAVDRLPIGPGDVPVLDVPVPDKSVPPLGRLA